MYIRKTMTVKVITISKFADILEARTLMVANRCRHLPVVDENDTLAGIITDRDVRLAMNSPIILHGRWQDEDLLLTATANSCMTPGPMTISSDAPAYRAAEMLSAYKFGALPVIDKGVLVGIITVTDFLDRFASEQPLAPRTK